MEDKGAKALYDMLKYNTTLNELHLSLINTILRVLKYFQGFAEQFQGEVLKTKNLVGSSNTLIVMGSPLELFCKTLELF